MEGKETKKLPIYCLSDIQLAYENISVIESTYRFEKDMMSAVQQGDIKKVEELYDSVSIPEGSATTDQKFPQDPIRHDKNLAIIWNTLLRIAAQKGGLPIAYLHTISEKFALIIEGNTSMEYLRNILPKEMALEYTSAVANFSTVTHSDIIKDTIRYLTTNITKNISLTEIGIYLGVNPSYLSRIFKEETGMSLIKYINHQRIELSKYFFETEMDNITEVAFRVGYNDSSYFTKTFKKLTGISPKEYIKNLQGRKSI